jgi:hypothetical protein
MHVSRTRILIALLVVVVLIQIYPDRAPIVELLAVIGAAVYFGVWAGITLLRHQRQQTALSRQATADEEEYQRYRSALDAVRARHDPNRDLNDPTRISQDYKDDLAALHDRHQEMLARKFGPR